MFDARPNEQWTRHTVSLLEHVAAALGNDALLLHITLENDNLNAI